MNRKNAHYHIRWSGKEALDWEAFDSRADAEIGAAQLVRFGETYTIEERDQDCARCRDAFKLKTAHQAEPEPKTQYMWQQAVREAFKASPEFLPMKVSAAERAISARLCDNTPACPDEQAAIREALHSLRALLPEQSPKQISEHKSESVDKKQIA